MRFRVTYVTRATAVVDLPAECVYDDGTPDIDALCEALEYIAGADAELVDYMGVEE